jgi:uncharacterized membrane protein
MTTATKKILAAILCFGFVYRILSLGKPQLRTDELLQALVVRFSSLRGLLVHLRDGAPLPAPLDFLIQKLSVLVLGDSSWALRFHAVVLASLSLWFFYRVGRQLFGSWVALFSTALLALYPLHYQYSQEGRPYALVLLLTLISFDLLLRQLTAREDGWKGWAAQALVLVLLLYSTLLGILVLIAELSCLVASRILSGRSASVRVFAEDHENVPDLPAVRSGQIVSYLIVAAVSFSAFLPWIKFILGSPAIPGAAPAVRIRYLWEVVREIGDNSIFVTFLLVLGVVPGLRALFRHGRRQSLLLLAVWSAVIIIGIIVTDFWSAAWFPTPYLLLAAPPLVLIAGYGISHLGERLAILDRLPYSISSPAIAYIAILLIASGWIAQSHWRSEPVDWKGTADFLSRALRPGDVAVMPQIYPLLEYYAPNLEEYRADEMSPVLAWAAKGEGKRYFVVCLNGLIPDPCAGFRPLVLKDRAWRRIEFLRGFTIFTREQ